MLCFCRGCVRLCTFRMFTSTDAPTHTTQSCSQHFGELQLLCCGSCSCWGLLVRRWNIVSCACSEAGDWGHRVFLFPVGNLFTMMQAI